MGTQVLGSDCSVSYSGNRNTLWEPFARLVLEASYEAVFRVAMLTALRHGGRAGSNRVFLTCLGGGVYGNPLNWSVDAMEAAMRKFSSVNLEVFIVTYGGHVNAELERLEESFAGSSEAPPKQTRLRSLFPLCHFPFVMESRIVAFVADSCCCCCCFGVFADAALPLTVAARLLVQI